MAESNVTIAIVANSLVSPASMSGGDRILLELSKRWEESGHKVDFYACAEAASLFEKDIPKASCKLLSTAAVRRFGVIGAYVIRLLQSLSIVKRGRGANIVFSSSDFLTDLIPSCLFKRRFRGSRLVSALYLRAPSPFTTKYARSVNGLAYFFSQRIAIGLMKHYADRVYVLNDLDREFLERSGLKYRVKVIRGGVDLELIQKVVPTRSEKFDACFIGRLHEQKGIDDLIEIWNYVCQDRMHSRLAIIGWGDEGKVARLKNRISDKHLNGNVDFLGFLDGADKIATLKSSKILVFPSSYESWGLVVCEAMAAEVPVVSYDLDVLKRAFSGGLRTVPLGDKKGFSNAIVRLLEDKDYYLSLRNECIHLATKFGWNEVARATLEDFQYITNNRSESPQL
jgi:glycosyltransferase involved in cell wall biosynthesis